TGLLLPFSRSAPRWAQPGSWAILEWSGSASRSAPPWAQPADKGSLFARPGSLAIPEGSGSHTARRAKSSAVGYWRPAVRSQELPPQEDRGTLTGLREQSALAVPSCPAEEPPGQPGARCLTSPSVPCQIIAVPSAHLKPWRTP